MAPRRVTYEMKLADGRMVVHARIADGAGRVWTARATTMRAAFSDIVLQLERAAGRRDPAARKLLGVMDGMPARRPSKKGPAQGGLL